jgi:hypothetical protein
MRAPRRPAHLLGLPANLVDATGRWLVGAKGNYSSVCLSRTDRAAIAAPHGQLATSHPLRHAQPQRGSPADSERRGPPGRGGETSAARYSLGLAGSVQKIRAPAPSAARALARRRARTAGAPAPLAARTERPARAAQGASTAPPATGVPHRQPRRRAPETRVEEAGLIDFDTLHGKQDAARVEAEVDALGEAALDLHDATHGRCGVGRRSAVPRRIGLYRVGPFLHGTARWRSRRRGCTGSRVHG